MTIPEIQDYTQSLIITGDTRAAFDFAKKLESSLIENEVQQKNKEAFIAITRIIFSLYLFSIEFVSDDLLQKMIRYNIREMVRFEFDSSWDLIYHLEQRFLIYPVFIMKQKMQEICLTPLERSTQILGATKLNISIENTNQEPTIANWIKYYTRKIAGTQKSNFTRSKFFSSDEALLPLSSQEKSDLRSIIAFYDYLLDNSIVTFEIEDTSSAKKSEVSISHQPQKTSQPTEASKNIQPASPQQKPVPKNIKPLPKSQTIDLKKMMEDNQS